MQPTESPTLSNTKSETVTDGIGHAPSSMSQTTAGTAQESRDKDKLARRAMRTKHDNVKLPNGRFYRLGVWLERKISNLSVRNTFWNRVCSLVWMPLAYRSGIKVHKGSVGTFAAMLPFRRFNRNWYKAMAGGALLANSELAGGMFVFKKCSGDWTVVCKELNYKFMRPCFGPAVYNIEPREDLDELIKAGDEFNITLDMEIVQMVQAKVERERRVGLCTATFHVTPKTQHRKRKHWQKVRERQRQLEEEAMKLEQTEGSDASDNSAGQRKD